MARFRVQIMSLRCNFSTFFGSVATVSFIFRLHEVANDYYQLYQHLNLTEKREYPPLNSLSKSLVCSVCVMAIYKSGAMARRMQWANWAGMNYKLLHPKDLELRSTILEILWIEIKKSGLLSRKRNYHQKKREWLQNSKNSRYSSWGGNEDEIIWQIFTKAVNSNSFKQCFLVLKMTVFNSLFSTCLYFISVLCLNQDIWILSSTGQKTEKLKDSILTLQNKDSYVHSASLIRIVWTSSKKA